MEAIRAFTLVVLVGIVGIGLLAVPLVEAEAALVEADLNSVGDALMTRDTETGLDWLDFSLTFGVHYTQANINFGPQGFRHATQSEVFQMFQSAGFSAVDGIFRTVDILPAILLNQLIGQADTSSGFGARGLFDFDIFDANFAGFGEWRNAGNIEGMATVEAEFGEFGSTSRKFTSNSRTGNFMVRAVVPLPPSVALFGTALLGLAVIRRRKRPGLGVSQQRV